MTIPKNTHRMSTRSKTVQKVRSRVAPAEQRLLDVMEEDAALLQDLSDVIGRIVRMEMDMGTMRTVTLQTTVSTLLLVKQLIQWAVLNNRKTMTSMV